MIKNKIKIGFLLNSIVVMQMSGDPIFMSKDQDVALKYKKGQVINHAVSLKTSDQDFLVLNIDQKYQLTVLPSSAVIIEGFSDKEGFFTDSIEVTSGQIHVQENLIESKNAESKNAEQKNIDLKSADAQSILLESVFFKLNLPEIKKVSFLVDLDPKKGILKVCNHSPEFTFKLFDHEIEQKLAPLKGIQFNGVVDQNGKVQFDQLLENRKIPKGSWGKITDCDLKLVQNIQDKINKEEDKQKVSLKKELKNQILNKKKQDDQYLCHEPYGQLNQCSYVFQKDKCLRQRCNAEGRWADPNEVSRSKNKCTSKIHVTACDY
jgi:hypothetical protein